MPADCPSPSRYSAWRGGDLGPRPTRTVATPITTKGQKDYDDAIADYNEAISLDFMVLMG